VAGQSDIEVEARSEANSVVCGGKSGQKILAGHAALQRQQPRPSDD
jgi:hypothetical protein